MNRVFNLDKLFDLKNDNIRVDAIKTSESGDYIVVRMHEFRNKEGYLDILFNSIVKNVYVSNILEDNLYEYKDGYKIKCYEILTLLIKI